LTTLWVFFFPWTREAREEEDFSSPAFLLSLSLLNLKKTSRQPPHLLTTWWKKEGDVPFGRFGAVVQWPPRPRTPWIGVVGGLPPPPSVLPINTEGGKLRKGIEKGEKRKKKRETKDERDERTQERKKEKKGKKMKEKNR
jgi:hypothetical protein